jgi:hypothetical protein
LPIITTEHAKSHLANKEGGEAFTDVYELDAFKSMMIDIKRGGKGDVLGQNVGKVPAIKVNGMPGKHVDLEASDARAHHDIVQAVRISFLLTQA